MFTRSHRNANDSRNRSVRTSCFVPLLPNSFRSLTLAAYECKKKLQRWRFTKLLSAIILKFPLFLSLTSSVKTDSRFFPSVNVNCPFKLFQNLLPVLNFIAIVKKVQIFKYRIRFKYRWAILLKFEKTRFVGHLHVWLAFECLPLSACLGVLTSEMIEFQSSSEPLTYLSNERVVAIVTSTTGRPHYVFVVNNCWQENEQKLRFMNKALKIAYLNYISVWISQLCWMKC